MKDVGQILENFSKSIGNTNMQVFKLDNGKNLFAKLEWENLYGSVKDRAAIAMLRNVHELNSSAISSGKYEILEYSGGNLGLSLAYMCFELGIKLNLVLLDTINQDILDLLEKLNVRVHLVDKNEGFLGVILRAKKLSRANPLFIFLYQHKNTSNIDVHYRFTGQEIVKQINKLSESTHFAFVANIGTGSTLIGNYLRLKESLDIDLYATTPAEMPYGTTLKPYAIRKFAGSGGLGHGLKQYFVSPYDSDIVEHFNINIEQCYKAINIFQKKYKITIGTSSAANYLAAIEISNKTGLDVITIFPDKLPDYEKVYLNDAE
ncbi:MAG: pyridoxal-phosphate dependent enzyme [Neisseriaceae bacterium]|nr:MAG: pyridoxal-phosphate dependent enzyme [Neisseriaceae bacterium]